MPANPKDVLDTYGLCVRDRLLTLSSDCTLEKRGVIIDGKYCFRFFGDSASTQYQLDGGLWDSLNASRKGNVISVLVDLGTLSDLPRGFMKYGAKMYGVNFSEETLQSLGVKYAVHYDESSGLENPEKISLGVYPREDGVTVLYLEELSSFSVSQPVIKNKFLHAEYSREERIFTHIDGAYKTYSQAAYLKRYASSPVAAMHSDLGYDKVFRLDGKTRFANWLMLASGFFYGNKLLAELMGSKLGTK